MNYELGCEWHFAEIGTNAGDEGPNSAMSQTFVQFPCAALVRESIQNSLDAAISENIPVKVCFEYRILERNEYKNFFTITEHIKACREYYKSNKAANAIYPKMLDYLNNSNEIGFIRVSDFNTKGMNYEEGATDKTFYAFVRAAGVSVKQAEGSGGSFGFGKGAFFVMSPLNTLIVSTCNNDGKCYFEGVTRLCSHIINGKKLSHMGFYDNNNGQPTSNSNNIPLPFRRQKPGTSIGIMGIEQNEWRNSIDELAKEVLSNFFVAVLRGKLEVFINGNEDSNKETIIINKNTIKKLIEQYFTTTRDVRNKKIFNPRPYFEAMTSSDIPPFSAELSTLGHVELYLKEFENNVTQIIFMRKLLMKVFRDSKNLGNYNGVFICENEQGNKILGDMEDPEHKSWNQEQCKKAEVDTSFNTACLAEREINKFINDCLEKLLNINKADSIQVAGLEKYLPAMDEKGKGERNNPFTGRPTGSYVKESASLTTEGTIKTENKKQHKYRGNVAEINLGNFIKQKGGGIFGGTGGSRNGSSGNVKVPGDHYAEGVIEDGKGSFKRIVDVDWRPVQSLKKGYTDIIIYSKKEILNAELQFRIGRESQSRNANNEDVYLLSTNKGKYKGLKITGVHIKANAKNIIQVSFSDKMYHSLILSVYEID